MAEQVGRPSQSNRASTALGVRPESPFWAVLRAFCGSSLSGTDPRWSARSHLPAGLLGPQPLRWVLAGLARALPWVPTLLVPVALWWAMHLDARADAAGLRQPVKPRREMPGVQVFAEDLRTHLPEGVRSLYEYNSNPPTSGPHWEDVRVPTRFVPVPLPVEVQLHELEHGVILVQYRCEEPCPDLATRLESLARPNRDVIIAPNPQLPARVVATAWRRLLTLDDFDERRLGDFIKNYSFARRQRTPLWPLRSFLFRGLVLVGVMDGPPKPGAATLGADPLSTNVGAKRWSFDDLRVGTLPPGWRIAGRDLEEINTGGWRVDALGDVAPSPPNALRLRSVNGNDHFVILPGEYRDFAFQAQVFWEPHDQATHQFSIVFRGADLLNYYRLRVYQRALRNFPVLYLARVDSLQPETLYEMDSDQMRLLAGVWYTLSLKVSGATIDVAITVDDERGQPQQVAVFQVDDTRLLAVHGSTVAITAFANTKLWVDDVVVEPSHPPGSELARPPTEPSDG